VTHLKKLMLEELERRNYAASTTRAYLRAVDEYATLLQPLRTSSDRITSASTRRICSAKESFSPTPSSSTWAESVSSRPECQCDVSYR